MEVATGAISSLLPKLRELIREDYRLQKGVKRQLEFLLEELDSVEAFLLMVAEASPEMIDEHGRLWAHNIREVSYDMEDLLDTSLLSAGRGRGRINTGSRMKRAVKKMGHLPRKGAMTRVDISAAIQDIRMQLQEVSHRRRRYTTTVSTAVAAETSTAVDPRLPALYRNECELVGINEPREELVAMLTQGNNGENQQQIKVVSIVGEGGVGKTTLAKAVYDRLEPQFDCSAFVSVSRNPDMKKVLRDILLELDDEAMDYRRLIALDERSLIDEIREFIRDKRCLIVIDDIWDGQDWKNIKSALVDNCSGRSRIITTTRSHEVAVAAAGQHTYILRPLSYDNSEKLFYKRIFGGDGNCQNSQQAEVSDKILKKCSGLPLAIITVASVLASKPWEEWSEVYNNSIAALRKGSNRYVDNMRKVLSLSYYDLPLHLRLCLLHLSSFPDNCWIEKDFLIWKWIAEGLVEPGWEGLFEVGGDYFNNLVSRSMIQIAEGHAYGCRVHPTVLSLIHSISSEAYFSTVFDDEHDTPPDRRRSNTIRRIAMHTRNVEHHIDTSNMSMGKVRSFSGSLCFVDRLPQLSSFQVLRVLSLEYCPGLSSTHLKQVGKLVLLRYLGLVGAGELELPDEAVGGLRFLQTLDLRETAIEQWSSSITKLDSLMCLCAGRIRTAALERMVRMQYLEDLRLHHVSGDDCVRLVLELGGLRRLRVLQVGFEEMEAELEKALLESLRELQNIEHLEVHSKSTTSSSYSDWVLPPRIRHMVFGGIFFSRVPPWTDDRFPVRDLSHLQMGVEVLEDGDMETLGCRFLSLRSLILLMTGYSSYGQGHRSITRVAGSDRPAFRSLKFFTTNMPVKFESRPGQPPPMPQLEVVEFHVSVQAAKDANSWLSSLANLPSLVKATVVLHCRGASTRETEEAEETLTREADDIRRNPRRLQLEVTRRNESDEVSLGEQFRFRNPHFQAMQREMDKMLANRQAQVVQPRDDDDDDRDEISPAEHGSQY